MTLTLVSTSLSPWSISKTPQKQPIHIKRVQCNEYFVPQVLIIISNKSNFLGISFLQGAHKNCFHFLFSYFSQLPRLSQYKHWTFFCSPIHVDYKIPETFGT